MKRVTLHAIDIFSKPITTTNCQDTVSMVSDDQYYEIKSIEGGTGWLLVTPKGEYVLHKHPVLNYWHTTCKGHKVQVTIRKMVAHLRWW